MLQPLRSWLNSRPLLSAALGCAVVGMAIFLIFGRGGGESAWTDVPTAKAYFVDQNDVSQVSVRSRTDIPPLPNEKGELTIVRAVFMTQGDSAAKSLAYVEKYTPEVKGQLEAMVRKGTPWVESGGIAEGHLVRSPVPDGQWVQMDSVEGCRIMKGTFGPGPRPQVVNP